MSNRFAPLAALLLIGMSWSGTATAQKQTAEGAQKFLSMVARQGSAVALVSGLVPVVLVRLENNNYWDHSESRLVEKSDWVRREENYRYVRNAATIEPGSSLCQTIAQAAPIDPAEKIEVPGYPQGPWTQTPKNPPVVLRATINWARATIKRGAFLFPDGSTTAVFMEPDKAVTVQMGNRTLAYRSESPEMLDRIEFAMKFLQTSCDQTAETGF